MQIAASDAAKQMLTMLTIRLRCCAMSSNMGMQEGCIHVTFERLEALITAACSGMPCMHLKTADKWYIKDLSAITKAPNAKASRRTSCVSEAVWYVKLYREYHSALAASSATHMILRSESMM